MKSMAKRYDWEHKQARKIVEKHFGLKKLSMFLVVHHIDGNPKNNNISNLKIMTREEHNSLHHLSGKGVKHKNPQWNKLPIWKIEKIKDLHNYGFNNVKIAKELNISGQTVGVYLKK